MSKVPRPLREVWRRKLAASGFRDIEQGDQLSNRGNYCGNVRDLEGLDEYYSRARTHRRGGSDVDRRIWAMHADHVGIRDIARRLRRVLGGAPGGRFKAVRESINAGKAELRNQTRQGAQGAQGAQCQNAKPERMLRTLDLDTGTLLELVVALTARQKPWSATSSASSGPMSTASSETSP